MMPYPEPYQTLFQQRRLGALGIEWRPSTMRLAIGPEISLGLDYHMPPLPDLDRIIEPLPEFIDAMLWEPENEVLSEDSDSEYNVTEENSSEGEKESISSSSNDSEFDDGRSGHDHKDGLRRSRRKQHKVKVHVLFYWFLFLLPSTHPLFLRNPLCFINYLDLLFL